ncbi:hypothetical protein ABZ234_08315 [Nocardiopsis sp. NPDC006198]|uniref:hypothetical protein n=1 Tax=Nocardiopsis sp. NPDC006198 TaxID=3154472 RepID=UPI0033AC7CAF
MDTNPGSTGTFGEIALLAGILSVPVPTMALLVAGPRLAALDSAVWTSGLLAGAALGLPAWIAGLLLRRGLTSPLMLTHVGTIASWRCLRCWLHRADCVALASALVAVLSLTAGRTLTLARWLLPLWPVR